MKIAIVLYNSVDNPKGIPSSWPAQTFVLTEDQESLIQDGYIEYDNTSWIVMTQEEYDQYVASCQEDYNSWYISYQASLQPTEQEILHKTVEDKIDAAMKFGNQLMMDFATENVLLGITQAGKVGVVTDFLHKLSHYITTGSLYQAIIEIDLLISNGIDINLSPFVTEERLLTYKTKIQSFLA